MKLTPPHLPEDPAELFRPERPIDWSGRTPAPTLPVFEPLPFGEIRPRGWLLGQLRRDLREGFVGVLDQITPTIFADDLYVRDRRTKIRDSGETGSLWVDDGIWAEIEMKWWNAETQGNWLDGFLRTAILADDQEAIARAGVWVERLLASQDADGYLGIYGSDLRFRHEAENGELWALTTVGRALLAWGDARGDQRILPAVCRAVDCAMKHSLRPDYHLFAVKQPWGGITHNLMLMDVLVGLYRRTGDRRFAGYAVEMFRQFAEHPTRNDDLCLCHLADAERPFYKHGVHVYEHLRCLLYAWSLTGYADLAGAWQSALAKLWPCITASGGPIGFEDVCGATAHPRETGIEMCSIAELQCSLTEALLQLGEAGLGDLVERMAFNAAPGQRSPDQKGLCYLRCDTQGVLDGHEPDGALNPRYKLSPAHQDCAVCCAPNAGRTYPLYIASMAARHADGLALLLHGPCLVETNWNETPVKIEVTTDYPFNGRLTIRVTAAQPVRFALRVRVPESASPRLDLPHCTECGFLILDREWHDETFSIDFDFQPRREPAPGGEFSIHWGPLLFARAIAGHMVKLKDHAVPGFADFHVHPVADVPLATVPEGPVRVEYKPIPEGGNPWTSPPIKLHLNGESPAELVPMACSVLRQTTFHSA